MLRPYLASAESCGETLTAKPPRHPDATPLTLDIREALESAGVPPICQHGVGRYHLEFAATYPDQPGRLVLAIETDGASCHSAETARDRDRLRQEQVERPGWRFHRIWPQGWFTDRKREVDKAVAAYLAGAPQVTPPEPRRR